MNPLVRIPVGVVLERSKASSPWIDFLWQPVAVLPGEPEATPWTKLKEEADRTTFYAGRADVELHASDTANYRDNLSTGQPVLWVVIRPTGTEPPFEVVCVTADGSEGESFTAAGNDIVESVPMPEAIRNALDTFVFEHHVERPFYKRQQNRPDLEALGRRSRVDKGEE
ncbi:MAG: DUF3305 domain-containing protein [Pseudomonadota bacterium]